MDHHVHAFSPSTFFLDFTPPASPSSSPRPQPPLLSSFKPSSPSPPSHTSYSLDLLDLHERQLSAIASQRTGNVGRLRRRAGVRNLNSDSPQSEHLALPEFSFPSGASVTTIEDERPRSGFPFFQEASQQSDYSASSQYRVRREVLSDPALLVDASIERAQRVTICRPKHLTRISSPPRLNSQPFREIKPLSPDSSTGRASPQYYSSSREELPSLNSDHSSHSSLLNIPRFPQPPPACEPTPPNSSQGKRPETSHSPPTIYHFRGASFEIVNPRDSLCLQNIETPAEPELEHEDYFDFLGDMEGTETEGSKSRASSLYSKDAAVRSTPPRSLYDDLPSAYNSILSRSSQKSRESPAKNIDLPQPHLQPSVEQKVSPTEGTRPVKPADSPPDKALPETPTRSTSLRRKLSNKLRMKKHKHGQSTENLLTRTTSTPKRPPRPDFPRRRHSISSVGTAGGSSIDSAELQDDSSRHYYDDLSVFNSSTGQNDSGSVGLHSLAAPPDNISHDEEGGGNQSKDSLIDAYNYEFGEKPQFTKTSSALTHCSTSGRDSTIANILDDYQHRDESATADSEISASRNVKDVSSVHDSRAKSHGPVLIQSIADYSNYEFGLGEKDKNTGHEEDQDKNIADFQAAKHKRSLTPGPGPKFPLPAIPSIALQRPKAGFANRDVLAMSSSELRSEAANYDDTEKLLLLSDTSLEVGRGVGSSNLKEPPSTPTSAGEAHATPSSGGDEKRKSATLSVPSASRSPSSRSRMELEEIIQRDLKRLSDASGASNLSGSIFLFSNDATTSDADEEPAAEASSQSSSSSHLETANIQEDPYTPDTPANSNFVPVAAFSHRKVQPGIQRLSAEQRQAILSGTTIKQVPPREMAESPGPCEDDEDESEEWETIAESRRTIGSRISDDLGSFADYSSVNSLRTLSNVGVHPGDTRFEHSYRLQAGQESEEPMLMPSYDFRGGVGFPNRNALTPPVLYNGYKHPSPLPKSHENPFTSPAPYISPNSAKKANDSTTYQFDHGKTPNTTSSERQRSALSVVHELPETPTIGSHETKARANPVRSESDYSSEEWLSTADCPDASIEAQYASSPSDEDPSPYIMKSGADRRLIHLLRKDDTRMASTPLSESNSFAKVSKLGGKANITGTPNGTNMREVGSSMVGSSSPFYMPSSPPELVKSSPSTIVTPIRMPIRTAGTPSTKYSPATPATPASNARLDGLRSLPLVRDPNSPLAQYDERHFGTGKWIAQHSLEPKESTESFRDDMIAATRAEESKRRSSVAGQTQLLNITLATQEEIRRGSIPMCALDDRGRARFRREEPLLPMHNPSARSPHLINHVATGPEAEEILRKTRFISRCIFGFGICFPPALVAYGHGAFDSAVSNLTKGEAKEFTKSCRRAGLWVGYVGTTTWILVLVIFYIIVRTVPNNLPR